MLRKIGLHERSAVTVCPDEVSRAKPDPEALLLACEQLTACPNKTIYVGDHERDIIAGKAANMPTIAAKYGYIDSPERAYDWRADQVIARADALIQLIA